MSKVGDAVSPDGADNIGLSTVANTATAPTTKRGEHRQDERTAFEVRVSAVTCPNTRMLPVAQGVGAMARACN
jgi:hypothetical protein